MLSEYVILTLVNDWNLNVYLSEDGLVEMSEIDPIGRYLGSSVRSTLKHNTRYSAFEVRKHLTFHLSTRLFDTAIELYTPQ